MSVIKNIGSLMKSKAAGKNGYIKVDHYHGDIIFRNRETGKETPILHIRLGTPDAKAPDFVLNSVYITLDEEDEEKSL